MAKKIKNKSSKAIPSVANADQGIENIDIVYASKPDENTIVLTSAQQFDRYIKEAVAAYDPKNTLYSAYLSDTGTPSTLTLSNISNLGQNAQSNLSNIVEINGIVRQYVNTNDLIGMVVQSISNNINTDYRLSYPSFDGQRNKTKMLERVEGLIEDFNSQVDLKRIIYESILITYLEGNYCGVLRKKDENWQIDQLSLSVVEHSGYEQNGNPVMLVNIQNLRNALNKTYLKNRDGSFLFFSNINEEVEANFPKEVYDALVEKNTYAVLDQNYTGVCRINNFGKRYGLTPIFRALAPTIILDDYQNADSSMAKAKSKKIIHQKMRKECLGPSGDRKAFEEMAYAHQQLMQAWQNNTVIVTTGPFVESISYVEPKTEDIPEEKINIYRNKVLSSLGVAFLAADRSQTASTANINLDQLMKQINCISEQTERMIEHFYETLLAENNIDRVYCPKIQVIDSELLEMSVRMELSKLLYATYGCSRDTAYGLVGIDVASEAVKRQKENEDGYSDIFTPYATSFNSDGYPTDPTVPETGRPSTTEDEDKGAYDEVYNETRQ